MHIILNPAAARGEGIGHSRLEDLLARAGLRYDLTVVGSPEECQALAEQGAAAGQTVVAAGGDGTVHHVANGLLRSDNPEARLGVLPLGTGNDFATALRLGGLRGAVDALSRGRASSIDVGWVNRGEYFVNGLGIGFDAEVVRRRERGRARSYLWSVARAFFDYDPASYGIRWRDSTWDGPILLLAAMNGVSEGGGFRLTPEASLDDGLLDICRIDPVGLRDFVRYVGAVRRGTHTRLPMVQLCRAERLRVESDAPIAYHVDGEFRELSAGETMEIVVERRRLKVMR